MEGSAVRGQRQGVRGKCFGAWSWARVAGAVCAALPMEVSGPEAQAEEAAPSQATAGTPALDDQIDAAEADGDSPRRQLVAWNSYEGPYFTLRVGAGLGWDYSAYAQDEDSKEQMKLSPTDGLRDFRLL